MLAAYALLLVSVLTSNVALARAADCASLTGLELKDTKITSATVIAAEGMIPEYCKVLGTIHNLPHSTILFEVSLPTLKWNGKYFVAGGGGYNGVIPKLTQALAEGYAAAGSDTGHEAKDANWALNNLDAQNNYAYLATHVVTLIGKQILRAFYNRFGRSGDRPDEINDAVRMERAGSCPGSDSACQNSSDRESHDERLP